jgi:ribose transport system substrate-binding protein
MKKVAVFFFLFALCLTAACNRAQEPSSTPGPRVAMVFKTLNNPFFIDMQKGAQAAAQQLGVSLTVQAAEREVDVEKQMQIIENLIQTEVDAICVTPSGSREIIPAIAKANAAGIPVIIVDTRLDGSAAQAAAVEFATFIGSDNYEGGRVAGRYMAELLQGNAKVAILEGIPGHETGDARLRGFRDAVQDTPGIQVVASQPANWERDQGFGVCQNLLQAHPDLSAIFACNDMMALGAMEAVAAAGKTGQIKIIGFDAITDARQAIAAGTLAASVAQFPSDMGRLAVESAVKVIRGEKLPEYVPVKIELINKENVAR